MAKENEIVSFINSEIQKSLTDKRFAGAQFSGITILSLASDDGTSQQVKACTVTMDGDCNWITIDNKIPLQVYHRTNGAGFPPVKPSENFGDNLQTNQATNMSLFVIGQRDMLKLTPEDLLSLIADKFPSIIPNAMRADLKLSTCSISIVNSDLNSQAVFKRENQIKNTVLDPKVIMFELKYQIECSYSKACINTICC